MYTFPNYQPAEDKVKIPMHRLDRARLDGGEMISRDGETIYHFRYGYYWRASWSGDRFGAWERMDGYPDGAAKLPHSDSQ